MADREVRCPPLPRVALSCLEEPELSLATSLVCRFGGCTDVLSSRLRPAAAAAYAAAAVRVDNLGSEALSCWRRIAGIVPVIALSRHQGDEFRYPEFADLLVLPVDPLRLGELFAALLLRRQPQEPDDNDDSLSLIATHLGRVCGLAFGDRNRRILQRGVFQRMKARGLDDPAAYLAYLRRHGESRGELKRLVGLLTVGETFFFRTAGHFAALEKTILPDLIAARSSLQRLRLWSAGCASGEEAYSLALLLAEAFPQLERWDIEILATDISKPALAAARRGVYGERSLRHVEAGLRQRYFTPAGNGWQLNAAIRRRVSFAYDNLCGAGSGETFDLILCRNVLIYFAPETVRQVSARFAAALAADGVLLLGHAESAADFNPLLQRSSLPGGFCYRRKPASALQRPVETPAGGGAVHEYDVSGRPAGAVETPPAVLAGGRPEAGGALDPRRFLQRAQSQAAAGEIAAAIDTCRGAILLDLHYLAAHLLLGRLCLEAERLTPARSALAAALRLAEKLDPDLPYLDGDGQSAGRLVRQLRLELARPPFSN